MSSTSPLSATFDDFLFATVCEERNEMPLTVVSALARLDLDPWAEAAELARMPADGAARRLTSLLASVVNDPPAQPDRATIAARLVALLPTPVRAAALSRGHSSGALNARQLRAVRLTYLVFLVSIVASLLMGSLMPGAGASGPALGPVASTAIRR
jgi:hypothetical protein